VQGETIEDLMAARHTGRFRVVRQHKNTSDLWRQYESGLKQLLTKLGSDHLRSTELLILERRLLENLARARLYGDTSTSHIERAQILDALDRLALETVGRKFLALPSDSTAETVAFTQGPVEAVSFTRDPATGTIAFVHHEPIVIGNRDDMAQRLLEAVHEAHDAIELYGRIVAITRELNDQRAEALYSQDLGLALLNLAESEPAQSQAYLSRAAAALQQAIRLLDAIKAAPLLRARTRYHLGRCYHQSGRWPEAIALLEQAREVFARHKARPELAHALLELGQLYYQTEDFESAYIYLKDALRLFRRLGDTDGIAVTQEALGSMELQAAHPSDAIVSLREARQGYVALQRDERVRAVDHLLGMADRARQAAERMGATP